MVVLVPTYMCYALVPLLPAFPPRFVDAESDARVPRGKIRALNLWILHHGGIGANTFPSAHVTACIASSLVLLQHDFLVGICFLWISLSIAIAVVALRYHYIADAVLGIALPLVLFVILE
jgi:hypothetical protein